MSHQYEPGPDVPSSEERSKADASGRAFWLEQVIDGRCLQPMVAASAEFFGLSQNS